MRSFIRSIGMLPVLVLLCLAFYIRRGPLLHLAESWHRAQQASINAVLAAGMTFVILTGGIDLSVGSILAVAAWSA